MEIGRTIEQAKEAVELGKNNKTTTDK